MANSTLHLAGGNQITLSTATAASKTSVTISGPNTHPALQATLSGNTSGALAALSSGTITLAGGNNITLSQAGNAVTISGAAAGGAQTAISGISNSEVMYTSGTVKLSGTNNVTVFSTTGQAFVVSGANTHAQQTGISGIQNTETTYTSGTIELEGTNNITVFSTTGQRFRISGPNPGSLNLFEGNAITMSSSTAASITSITISNIYSTATSVSSVSNANAVGANNSRFAQEAHIHEGVRRVGISTQGNTEGNTGFFPGSNVQLVGSNMVSISQASDAASNVTLTLKATQSVQTQDVLSVGVSTGGNTAGNTTVNTGSRLVLSGQANITLSEATAAGATTIGISGAAGAGGNFSGGVSNLGNTAGSTGVTGTRLVFVGTNDVSLSQSTDANGGTITFDVASDPLFSAGVSTGGNTSGSTGITGTRLVLVGTNNILLSQSTDANGGTVSISVNDSTMSHWKNWNHMSWATVQSTAVTKSLKFFALHPAEALFPARITASTARLLVSVSGSTATMTASHTSAFSLAVYSVSASDSQSTISLLNSVASTWATTYTASSDAANAYNGIRWITFHSSQWSVQPVFSQGVSYIGAMMWSNNNALPQTMAVFGGNIASHNVAFSGSINAVSNSNATLGPTPFLGHYSATTTAFPASVHVSQINKTENGNYFTPLVEFDMLYASH